MRTYKELIKYNTYKDRFEYLRLDGIVGEETFGFERYLNQRFYHSPEWRRVRHQIILRDEGCDLGIYGREIEGKIYIHHMNPISSQDIVHASDFLIDAENLICCTHYTHNAIHYGDSGLLIADPIERMPNDTCPWKKE